MENALFLQSDVADPYALYDRMLREQPVRRDEKNGIWAVYSHADCKHVLDAGIAQIPSQNPANMQMLNEAATTLVNNLVRLSNPPAHATGRQAVMRLFEKMQPMDTASLLARLLDSRSEVDWIDAVCKKLPALAVMAGFGFSDEDIACVLPRVEQLTRIMLPHKSEQQIADVNAVAKDVYALVERHVLATDALRMLAENDDMLALHVSNLIGLLIQSQDAGRGILSNTLLQALAHPAAGENRHGHYWQQAVVETLRFDPPIHNTRRVLTEDMVLGGRELKSGQAILLVLAAANRDPAVFERPAQYDVSRGNNDQHLTFGAGIHLCAARHFSIRLTVDALTTLFANGRRVQLLQAPIEYEAMINARLPKQLRIAIA